MQAPQRYEDLVRRLAAYGYDVRADPPGYIVQHRINTDDSGRTPSKSSARSSEQHRP